ncbi:MAG: SDR family NAD(P)-dependent oxidoreductase [Candidatus Diapherotrites archaeon]
MANVLVTGGAGFIGRWVVKKLLGEKHRVWVLDNLSNGSAENLAEFKGNKNFAGLVQGNVEDAALVSGLFSKNKFDLVIHLAAQINVQESIGNPRKSFDSNILGTFVLLEEMRKRRSLPKMALIGTCMVYDLASAGGAISESHPLKPLSPYAASKIAAEQLVEAYGNSYSLPYTILRPFNTYGPFQKSNMEGGVVSIFLQNALNKEPLKVFGSGKQTRDLLYVEDCTEFIVRAAFEKRAEGKVINAGSGQDISVNELAKIIARGKSKVLHVKHHHPQAEIMKLQCDYSLARKLLGWKPRHTLEEGINETREWLSRQGGN